MTNQTPTAQMDKLQQSVAELREDVKDIKEYIEDIKDGQKKTSQENFQQQADIEQWKAQQASDQAGKLAMFNSVITHGAGAIRALLLVSGGACLATFSFIAHLLTAEAAKPEFIALFMPALICFSISVVLAAATACLTYFCQWMEDRFGNWRSFTMYASIAMGFFALVLFAIGLSSIYSALSTFINIS